MKKRQYKKLCKKAAEAIRFSDCKVDDDLYYVFYKCRGVDFVEWDAEPAWDWLKDRFNANINTVVDDDSECGISWVPEHLVIKATPKNVLSWARNMVWY